MKPSKIITALGVLSLISFASCDSKNEHNDSNAVEVKTSEEKVNVEVKPEEKPVITEAELEIQRNEFKRDAELRIEANEKKIEELEAKMENADKKTRKEYKQRISELKERNKKQRDRLNGYNDNDNTKWDEFKREFNHDMDDLGKALDNFGENNKK